MTVYFTVFSDSSANWTPEEIDQRWQDLASDLSAMLQGHTGDIPESVAPFDAASEIPVDEQKWAADYMYMIISNPCFSSLCVFSNLYCDFLAFTWAQSIALCKNLVGGQGCALTAPGGPWYQTFAPGQLENLWFFVEILCKA